MSDVCPNCGEPLTPDDLNDGYCPSCGEELSDAELQLEHAIDLYWWRGGVW